MKHYANNPRQITRKEFEQLKNDLADLCDLGGLVHDLNTDQIIGGNQRARVFDLSKIEPIILQEFDPPTTQGTVALGYVEWNGERFSYRAVRWDDATARRANIRANMAGGAWDWDILSSWDAIELHGWGFSDDTLQGWKRDIAALGNLIESETPEPADAEPQFDKAAELLEKWQVKTGDLWRIGEHRLLCGDSTKREDVEKVMGGEKAGAVVTDPPYGQNQPGVTGDDPKDLSRLLTAAVSLFPCNGAAIIAFQSPRTFPVWLDIIRAAGHKFERMLWLYKQAQEVYPWRGWLLKSEAILISSVGIPEWQDVHPCVHDCYVLSEMSNEIHDGGSKKNPGPMWHGSIKPIKVVQDIVSRIGGIVFDPFVGSGTTIVACQNLSRSCRAIEIAPQYVAVCLERMSTAFPGIAIERAT